VKLVHREMQTVHLIEKETKKQLGIDVSARNSLVIAEKKASSIGGDDA